MISNQDAQNASMVDVCTSVIQSKMKSPSSYSESKILVSSKVPSGDDLDKRSQTFQTEQLREGIKNGLIKLRVVDIFIDFEASNALGVQLKGLARCEYNAFTDDWASLDSVVIDGASLSSADVIIETAGKKIDSGISSKIKYLEFKIKGKI